MNSDDQKLFDFAISKIFDDPTSGVLEIQCTAQTCPNTEFFSYLDQIWENKNQKICIFGHFLGSVSGVLDLLNLLRQKFFT